MNEILFLVEEAPGRAYTARARGDSIISKADDWEHRQDQVRDAARCHFEEGSAPQMIRLHFEREEVLGL